MSCQYSPEGPVFPAGDLEGIQIVRTKPWMPLHCLAGYVDAPSDDRRRRVSFEKRPSLYRLNLGRAGVRVTVAPTNFVPLVLSGVAIVDAPSLILHCQRGSLEEVGLLSFHVSKMRAHGESSARTAAVLLGELAAANQPLLGGGVLSHGMRLVIDVFSLVVADAYLGRSRRLVVAKRACEEITDLWPAL